MILLIDCDTPCYASAAAHENDSLEIACLEVDKLINKVIEDTECSGWEIYLTGDGNFRYGVYPEYKAHRLKTPTPRHLKDVKAHVTRAWGAIVAEGCEADDLLGIRQSTATEKTCICSIDKDLNQIPGKHYHPGITRLGKWIIEPHFYHVTKEQGLHFLYYQLLVGDNTDNIKGAIGIGPKKAENILTGCSTEQEYYEACLPFFSCEEELLLNARCVYIHQKEEDKEKLWLPPRMDKSS